MSGSKLLGLSIHSRRKKCLIFLWGCRPEKVPNSERLWLLSEEVENQRQVGPYLREGLVERRTWYGNLLMKNP